MAADVVSTRRSAANRPTPAPNARALTAAATVLDPTDRAQAAKVKSYRQDWQRHAWDFYECLSADTEILTRDHGWLTYDLLQVGDLVLTLDPESGTSGWEPVESIHVHPVEGIPVLSMESNRHSSLSTLDHRWPVSARLAGYRDRGPRWRTSATLRGADLIRTAAPCRDLSDDPKWTDAFVEVVGWFWTEGTIKPSPRGTTYSATIYQSRSANPAYVDRIRLALTKAFGPPSESLWRAAKSATAAWREQIVAGSEITRFRLNNLAAAQLTAVAPGRVVDRAFIRELTAAQLELFVAVSMMADGNADGRSLGQKSAAALSAFEYACILSGRGVVTRQYEPTITQLRVSRRTETTVESREIQEYSGTVWCPRTASATWLARRNGTVFYTGNTLPEIHFGHDYYGNVVSRVRLFAGFQVDPDDPPIPLDEVGEDGEMPEGANPETANAAVEEMRRLDQGSDGGLGGLAGDLAVNLALAGEGTIHGTEDPESQTGERFCVYSVEELKAVGEQGYQIFAKGTSMGREVGADDYVLRVWRRHRRFRDLADAPMRALLDTCDNLLLLTRVVYAASASRMHGGIFVAPTEWSFPQRKTDGNANGQANDDPLTEQIIIQSTTPIQSPKNATSVAPLVLRGPADTLDKARWIDLGRGYGKELLEQIEMVRRGIAVGLDLPVEVLEGLGDSNHWSAWQIDQDTFRAHVEPLVLMICRALTEGWLWLNLRARGLDPTGFVVGFDATALTGHPDLFNNMQTMHERFAVSDDALRRAGGASDDDAPDEDEVARRLWIEQQKRLTIRETGDAPPGEVQADPAGTTPPNVQDTPKAAPPNPLTDQSMAASGARDLRTLGVRLEQIDRDLRARIQTLADAALHRALEKAGASVVRKLRASQGRKGSSSGLAAEIRAMKTAEIPMLLGRETLTSMGLDEDKLIDGELGDLESKYRELTRRALTGALLMGRRHVPSGDLDDEEVTRRVQGQERWVAGGFAVLSAAVIAGAHDQLFTGPPNPSGPGEIDLTARVDPGAVRESLAVAGGAQVAAVSSAPAGGVATGQIVMDTFREALQILPQGWQWVYGYPDKPFEPHESLEGVEFSAWDDEILLNGESFPDVDYYRPADHPGCVVAGTVVAGQVPSATTLRWYEGIVCELSTASGEQLTITPNHPVLTDRGWVRAEALVEGDHLVRCLDPGRAASLIPDDDQVPTRVEDLFAARWVAPEMLACAVPVAAEDFHGDGLGSEVTVVCAHRDLMADGHPALPEPLTESGLAEAGRTASRLASARTPLAGLDRVGPATLGLIRSGGHRLAVLGGGAGMAEPLRLPVASWLVPSANETTSERGPAHAEVLGHGEQAFPSDVELDKLINIDRHTEFAGHVFNLHNEQQWYTANRIIVHNCQCSFIPMFGSDRPDEEPPEEG